MDENENGKKRVVSSRFSTIPVIINQMHQPLCQATPVNSLDGGVTFCDIKIQKKRLCYQLGQMADGSFYFSVFFFVNLKYLTFMFQVFLIVQQSATYGGLVQKIRLQSSNWCQFELNIKQIQQQKKSPSSGHFCIFLCVIIIL